MESPMTDIFGAGIMPTRQGDPEKKFAINIRYFDDPMQKKNTLYIYGAAWISVAAK